MAALSDNDRAAVWAEFMRQLTNGATYLKADLRAAINAADDWADSNAAEYNSALPQPYRGAASMKEKTLLLQFVILKRAGLL